MPKIVLSAFLKPFQGGVKAKSAEFPDLETTSWSVGGAISRLRQLLARRLSWRNLEVGCSGDPLSPVPLQDKDGIAVPIEVPVKIEQ